MSATFPWTVDLRAEAGRCGCGAVVFPASFRDRVSWREFHRTRLCQSCQDDLFFRASRPDARWRYPIRRAVVAAPVERDGAVVELGVLPFICILPEARVEWEARFLLRAGPRRGALELFDELFALSPALEMHQVRLTEVDDVRTRAASAAQEGALLRARRRSAVAEALRHTAVGAAFRVARRQRGRIGAARLRAARQCAHRAARWPVRAAAPPGAPPPRALHDPTPRSRFEARRTKPHRSQRASRRRERRRLKEDDDAYRVKTGRVLRKVAPETTRASAPAPEPAAV